MAEEDENTILSKLRIYLPDGIGSNTYTTQYTKISVLKTLNINAYSDTDMKLNLGWSVDGIHTDMIQEINIQSNRWYTEQIKIIMSYMRIGIEHITAKENSCLKITAFSPEDHSAVKPKPKKSIFSMKKEVITSPKKEKIYRDDRIPHIIFKGGLLMGKDGRNVCILPKGNEGDVLMIVNGAPSWTPVSRLFKNIDEKNEYEDEKLVAELGASISTPMNSSILPSEEEIVCDGIYDRSMPSPKKPANRPGSGLGNALSKNGLNVFGRNKSLTKKPPAFE